MNREVEIDNLENSKKRLKVYYSLLVSVLCFIGVSFALFQLYLRQNDNNAITALSCFNSTLTEENSAINLSDEFPITDENGLKKTPFKFKVTNNCDNFVKIYITMDPIKEGETGYIQSKYMKANVSTKGEVDGTSLIIGNQNTKVLENKDNGYILKEVGLKSKESKEFDLRLWIDYDTTKEQAAGMTYLSQVVIVTEAGIDNTLAGTILRDNEVQASITTPGREVSAHVLDDITTTSRSLFLIAKTDDYYVTYGTGWIANGTKFDLTGTQVTSDTYLNIYADLVGKYLPSASLSGFGSQTAGQMTTTTNLETIYYIVSATTGGFTYKALSSNKNMTEAELASTEDDYGTSYYFRGSVKNNYVEFANKCWRIVRIVGDGSVKLVLHNDNTTGASNPCSSANNSGDAAFARYDGNTFVSTFNSNCYDNAYVGFMYGTIGSSDYASTHANINKSTILTNLETWYKNNLASYESKLADTIWCNDKSTFTTYTNGLTYDPGSEWGEQTGYMALNRLYGGNTALYASPSLVCPNDDNGGKLSKFTVSDTTNGNGNLTYKIGLLTADEIAFAGYAYDLYNSNTYLNENAGQLHWLTMSPKELKLSFSDSYAENFVIGESGYDNHGYGSFAFGVRPAISLSSDTTILSGSGSSEDPYVVSN